MKRLILSSILLLSFFSAISCSTTPLCGYGGFFSFRGDPGYSTWAHVYTSDSQGTPNGVFDSVYHFPLGTLQTFRVPSNGAVTITVVWEQLTGNQYTTNISTSNGNSCAPLAIFNSSVEAKNDGNKTVIQFVVDSDQESNSLVVNYRMKDGTTRHFPIVFLERLRAKDKWEISIDNTTGKYTVTKK